jgi:DNA-binding PadR family transcriptional regulator
VSVTRGDSIGGLEHLVLLAVARLEDDAYGMSIRREIHGRASRDVAIGAVYATLERLEDKGLVRSVTKDPSADRDGRARRFFELTGSGERALVATADAHRRMWAGLRLKRVGKATR